LNRRNLLLSTDSYKASHWLQYPPGMQAMTSYIEARRELGETVFFGLQAIIQEFLSQPITMDDVVEAAALFQAHGEPFNYEGWQHIVDAHDGFMPVEILAVPEGTVVPNGNVLAVVNSTDHHVPWVASYLETLLLRVWYPTTVATKSYRMKQLIRRFMEETGADLAGLPFKLHDFGARGVSSGESAMLGGMGHLVNFMGTDTVEALVGMRRYYGADMAGFSIPAAEHSTITSWGKEYEGLAYLNMVHQYSKPGALYAVVSDSYDLANAVKNLWGGSLKQAVIDAGGTLVVRPDSGNAVQNVCDTVKALDESFGSTVNAKGFKVLNNVRVIQGDGINGEFAVAVILDALVRDGYSADNVAFGMGGGLLQHCNRDSEGFAMKCSAVKVNDEWRDVFKEAPGKNSKRGQLDLIRNEQGEFQTVPLTRGWSDKKVSCLQRVYHNGLQFNTLTLDEVRANTGAWK
jgi:nicotinamide phosphoribosyltransferase